MTAAPHREGPGFEDGSVEVDLGEELPNKTDAKPVKEQSGTDASFVKPTRHEPAVEAAEKKKPEVGQFEENWSERVQKRFGQLRAKQGAAERLAATERTARLAAEDAVRAEVADKAKAIERLVQYDRALATERGVALAQWERANKAERARVEVELREANVANAAGEADAAQRLATAQSEIARLAAEETQVQQEKARYKPPKDEDDKPKPEPQRQEQQQRQTLLPKAQAWIDSNPRFATDAEFADTARVIARKLIKDGVPADSDEHYAQLDKRLKAALAEDDDVDVELEALLEKKPQAEIVDDDTVEIVPSTRPRPAAVAAPSRPAVAAKAQAGNPRLTKEEVEAARNLGISNRKYWEGKQELEKAGTRPITRDRW